MDNFTTGLVAVEMAKNLIVKWGENGDDISEPIDIWADIAAKYDFLDTSGRYGACVKMLNSDLRDFDVIVTTSGKFFACWKQDESFNFQLPMENPTGWETATHDTKEVLVKYHILMWYMSREGH